MKKFKTRLLVILSSVIVGILFFEILFRIFYWSGQYLHANKLANTYQAPIILCVGNSFTLGVGAPRGESYPDHLQKMVSTDPFKKKFQVINLGRGAFNTTLVLENLETWLTQYQPRYVLFQVGEPNSWNRYGNERFLGIETHPVKEFLQKFSATYRYFSYLRNMKNAENSHDGDFNFAKENVILKSKDGPSFQAAKDLSMNCYISDWQKEAKENLKHSKDYYNLEQHIKNAELAFKDFPEIPASARVLYHLQLSCKNDFKATLPYLEKLIELEPEKKMLHLLNTYTTLNSSSYSASNQSKDKEDFLIFLQTNYPKYIPLLTEQISPRINDWIRSDLKKMIQLTYQANAQPIILNYPPRPSNEPRDVDGLLRTFAFQENIPFIDIEKYFNQIWEQGTYKKEELHEMKMGIPVEHLNGEGYKKLAEKVYQEMLRLNYL